MKNSKKLIDMLDLITTVTKDILTNHDVSLDIMNDPNEFSEWLEDTSGFDFDEYRILCMYSYMIDFKYVSFDSVDFYIVKQEF
jgi:hypothetical protein